MTGTYASTLAVPGAQWTSMLDELRDQCLAGHDEPTAATELLTIARWGVDPETKAFWRANAGNAKARRRWRRSNLPNSQRKP